MSLQPITDKVNHLGQAWEQFKQVNERRLSEIEKKGAADALTLEHLDTLNGVIDQTKSRLDAIELDAQRPARELKAVESPWETAENPIASQYRAALGQYLRKGQESGFAGLESKALSVGSDPDGGYLVTPAMAEQINATVRASSPMRQLASIETISTDGLEIIDDYDSAAAGWTTETGAISDTATPQINKRTIAVHEMYAQPKATQKLVDDAAIDIEAWLAEKVADTFTTLENAAFINGSGSGQPKGILQYAAGTSWEEIEQVNSGTDGAVTADGLIDLYYALKEEYARGATFLMNRSVVQAVRSLKESTTDQYLWQPGLAAGTPDTLLGIPVMQAADMPVAASASLSVALADFRRAYKIVDRIGMRVLRDPFTDKPFVKFYTTRRVGGDVANFEAIKLLKLSV